MMMDDGNEDLNVEETTNTIHSYIEEISDGISRKKDILKMRIEDLETNIKNIRNDLCILEVSDADNYKLFSPVYYGKSLDKDKLESQVSLLELQLNESMDEYNAYTLQVEHLNDIRKYIDDLESVNTKKKLRRAVNENAFLHENDDSKESHRIEGFGIKLLETQELERKRIARDLHDSTVQNLTSLIHKTELCAKYVDIDNIRTKLELETMKKTIRTTIHDMREIIYDLRPMSLDDLGFIVTVERYLDQLMKNSGIIVSFEVENEEYDLYPIVNSTLLRIIQEACNNTVKHAHANSIHVILAYNENDISLFVEDDGNGFDSEKYLQKKAKTNSSFGLSIMRERVFLLSGQFQIVSELHHGTKIYVTIPTNSGMEEKE